MLAQREGYKGTYESTFELTTTTMIGTTFLPFAVVLIFAQHCVKVGYNCLLGDTSWGEENA